MKETGENNEEKNQRIREKRLKFGSISKKRKEKILNSVSIVKAS